VVREHQTSSAKREAKNLGYLTRYRAECHMTAARFYSNVHMFVGMAAAGLAAIAGGTAFAGQTLAAGISAIGSAVLAGFLTIHKPDERTQSHWLGAGNYNSLADEIFLYERFDRRPAATEDASQTATDAALPRRANPERARSGVAADGDVATLEHFLRESAELEARTFPVSRHLCVKTDWFIQHDDEWYPPLRTGDFEVWKRRRAERPAPWWRLRRRGNPRHPTAEDATHAA
jgi:hypothetical protein